MNKILRSLLLLPVLGAAAACSPKSESIELHVDTDKTTYTIDLYQTLYITVNLDDTLLEKNVTGLSFEAAPQGTSSSGLSLSAIQDNHTMSIFATGVEGIYYVDVDAYINSVLSKSYSLTVNVVDNAPAPTKIQDFPNINLDAPKFPNKQTTSISTSIDLTQYVDASDYVTYQLDSSTTEGVTMDVSETKIATFGFTQFGENNVKLNFVFKEEIALSMSFKVNITGKVDYQLFNGDFEQGYDGWDVDEWAKLSYTIQDSGFDIWSNPIGNQGNYLYGYTNENGFVDIASSLFKVGGNRYVTMKLAGNCTDSLYISLNKFVENGDDIEIAKYNNWFYPVSKASGFIFSDYYFVIPQEYVDSQCYFIIHDSADAALEGGFGFINVDQITTYYTEAPDGLNLMYKAGFKVDPDAGIEFDYSDTRANPFTTTDVPYQLPNGDFEDGYSHWFMTTADKQAYSIIKSKKDIWSNPVGATNYYLYGYAQENYRGTFHSDLFKVGGSGYITFKIAGNSTQDLQFRLKKYVADGDDIEIAKFNNTYFQPQKRSWSGFIFQEYYYQIDLNTYADALCYFEVYDNRSSDFGFICLDDIVTYYQTTPTIKDTWYKAGFVNEVE